ncbi:MAG TPA: alpha/beta hydrolase [Baekduia sp.]
MARRDALLDPQLLDVLVELDAEGGPPLHAMNVEEARASVLALRRLNGPPAPMHEVAELELAGGAGRPLAARLYRPAAAARGGPVGVFFHGGGWTVGSIDFADGPVRDLAAASGMTWISCSYRLAPESPYPAPLEDAYAAVRSIAERAGELDVDGTRIGVAGESSGANLAAGVALAARDRGGPAIGHQLLVFPPLDTDLSRPSYDRYGEGYMLTTKDIAAFWANYVGERVYDPPSTAAPLRAASLAGLPSATVVVAACDPLRDDGEAYARRLGAAGVRAELVVWEGLTHGAFVMTGRVDRVPGLIAELGDAMRSALTGGGQPEPAVATIARPVERPLRRRRSPTR